MMVFAAAVHSAELPPPVDSGSLEGDLAALAERIAELTGSDQARAALAGLVAELGGDPDLAGALEERLFAAERRYLSLILERACARGELGRGAGPQAVWSALHALAGAGAAGQPWRLRGGETADVADLAGFRAFARPGFVLIATSFELEPLDHETRLSTETRVQPTDSAAARAFRPYWWAIRLGSGLIRRDMLRAVRRAAERDMDLDASSAQV
jgi:hypothetical protein